MKIHELKRELEKYPNPGEIHIDGQPLESIPATRHGNIIDFHPRTGDMDVAPSEGKKPQTSNPKPQTPN